MLHEKYSLLLLPECAMYKPLRIYSTIITKSVGTIPHDDKEGGESVYFVSCT